MPRSWRRVIAPAGFGALAMSGVVVACVLTFGGGAAGAAGGANAPGGAAAVHPPNKGLPASAYHNHWTSHPNPPLPTSGPPNICGPWSAATSKTVQANRATHGTLSSCLRIDHYWLVTTDGMTGPAEVGVLTCARSDDKCMDGWRPKDLAAFRWHPAPPTVTYLKIALVEGQRLTMLSNSGQWIFDLGTSAFARMTS